MNKQMEDFSILLNEYSLLNKVNPATRGNKGPFKYYVITSGGGHQMITFDYRGGVGSANDYMITGGEGGHQNIK